MKQEPGRTKAISEELVGALGRFKAWQATRRPELTSNIEDGGSSWKLVYEEALDSIHRLSQSVDPSLSGPCLVPSSPQAPPVTGNEPAEDSVTDIVTLRSRSSRPSNASAFQAPGATDRAKSPDAAAILNTGFEAASSQRPARLQEPAPPVPGIFNLQACVSRSPSSAQAVRLSKAEFGRATAELRREAGNRLRLNGGLEAAAEKRETGRRRDTSLTVRMTSLEAALLKRRAAEANVTLSAYLRQCALDVERLSKDAQELRAELEMRHRTTSQPAPQPEPSASVPAPRSSAKGFAARALQLLGVATADA